MGVTYTFIFVREDLPKPNQIVQACHAAFEMGRKLPLPEEDSIDNMVIVGVKDENALKAVEEKLDYNSINRHTFYEPDYDMGYTAICTEPLEEYRKKIFAKYKLLS